MNSQIVTVNLVPGLSAPAVVRVSQYDVGRPLTIRVFDGTGAASFGASVTATITGTKPSGLGFSVSGTIAGNTVTLNTTLAMTQERGKIPAEIRFTQTGEDIGTANFILAVEPSPHTEGTTDGTQETMANLETRLQSEINDLSDRIDDIEAGGSGLSQTEKNLILTLFSKAAYAENDAESAYDALEAMWASSTKTITYNLSHVSSSNTTASIEQGQSYTTTLTASTDYTLNTVTVTMGGVDITSTAYSSGTVSIPSVTGNIVITATAVLAAQSITATYTQSGTVYDTDSLDSLKADLVVTANYSGGTTETVPASNYTLSGTLTEGTSTITVSYAGLTDTFSVTVTHDDGTLYSWDFTQSLVDSKQGLTATINGNVTQNSSGITITAGNAYVLLGEIYAVGRTYEFDVANSGSLAYSNNGRLFTHSSKTTQDYSCGIVYRGNSSSWALYENAWQVPSPTQALDAIKGHTLKYVIESSTISFYIDNVLIVTATQETPFTNHMALGSSGNGLTGVTITAMRVYET